MKKTSLLAMGFVLLALAVAAAPNVLHKRLTEADLESEFPAIVWTGSQLGATWTDGRDGNQEIYFRTAEIESGYLGQEFRLTSSATFDDIPKVAWTGSEYALSWIHEGKAKFDLMFLRLDATGKPRGPAKALLKQGSLDKNTAICWTGAGFGVVASEFRGGPGQADLTYRYLDETGGPQGAATDLATELGIKVPSVMLRSGSDFSLIYHNVSNATIHLLRINPFGKPYGQPVIVNLPGAACGMPVAANNNTAMVVAWPQKAATGSQVIVTILSSGGDVISVPAPVTQVGPSRPAVAVAATRESFGVAWIEITDEGRRLFFQQLDLRGRPVGDPVRLSKPLPNKVMSNTLALCANSVGYVINWVDLASSTNSELILSRIGFLTPPPAPAVPVAPAAPAPAVPQSLVPAPASAPVPAPPPPPSAAPDSSVRGAP